MTMNSLGEADSRQRKQQTTRQENAHDKTRSGEFNSDEKKEADFRSMYAESSTWHGQENASNNANRGREAKSGFFDFDEENSPSIGTAQFEEKSQTQTTRRQIDRPGVETAMRTGVAGNGNGLHHRHHHFHAPATSSASGKNSGQSSIHMAVQTSPNRRRRARSAIGKSVENQIRKRKWTAMQVFRSLLIAGATLYFLVMIQILTQQHDANGDYNGESSTGHRFSDLIALPHPGMSGYLRSGAMSIEAMGPPFVQTPLREDSDVVNAMLERRLTERRSRTRPPIQQQEPTSIEAYVIDPTNLRSKLEQKQRLPQGGYQKSQVLANVTQLCGIQTQKARETRPDSFLRDDALMKSEAKVLITGIVSNPLAFHLALTLKSRCGVEVMIGVDPMLPNTIRNRLRYVEQMKILASNVPKMVQPALVPLLGLDPRVKKTKKGESSDHPLMLETTGEINLVNFQPTHIVHLSAATYQNPSSGDIQPNPFAPKRPLTPYQTTEGDSYEPSLFHIRSSLTAMEQILASAVSSTEKGESVPHVTYASATLNKDVALFSNDKILYYSKLADEVMADTYHFLFGTSSVGVRFPPNAVYGPWGEQDSAMYKLFDGAILGNFSSFDKHADEQHFIYVQDAVDAIITAMQYRRNEASTFELSSNSVTSLSTVGSMAHTFLTKPRSELPPDSLSQRPRKVQPLAWEPRTSLREGVLKTLAWHLDKASPYGPPPDSSDQQVSSASSPWPRTGDALLLKHSVPTCGADDLGCHVGATFLPCASECSVRAQCRPSIFDPVRDLTRDMTEGCDAVLYTQSLGPDIEDLQLQSQFEDDVEPAICNLAFVAKESPLVSAVIDKIPEAELVRLGVPANAPDAEKRRNLNGRLLYRGWILIWVDTLGSVSPADSSLMKLSPGRMFARDVLYAVFVEENFTVSPTMDDVRFLISQMDRGATKQRNVYRMIKKDEQSKPAKAKFIVPAQPEKRAAILVSQLKFKISERGRIPQDTKINILDAVRFMRFEIGSDPTKQKESSAIRRQKEFYRRVPTFINGKDLRDNGEPMYRYELKHWVRTRWVVHDLTLEESRELRCDWYQEHVQWASEVDQLSFAAIMAKRIIDRRMKLMEPDDRSKSKSADIAELKDITDNNEWFAMASESTKLDLLQHDHNAEIQQSHDDEGRDEAEDDGADEGPDVSADSMYSAKKKPNVGLYVRVISDRIMSLSRKAWARYRAELLQARKLAG